jgi:hypothetical protein
MSAIEQKVHEFQAGKDRVHITRREFKGKEYVDVRKFFKGSEGGQEKWYPTKKGISFALGDVNELIKGLCDVAEMEAKSTEVKSGAQPTNS